jgi:O-antigen/teichoic acid export membrane protein
MLMRGRSLLSLSVDSGAQLAGALIPAALMVVTFPVMQAALSPTNFSTFTVLFTMISLLSVADAGLGRAVTYFAARALEGGHERAALASLAGGLVFGLGFSLLGWILIHLAMSLLPSFAGADLGAVRTMSYALPLFIATGMLRGYLEARLRFVTVNVVQLLFGCSTSFVAVLTAGHIDDMATYALLFALLKLVQGAAYAWLIARQAAGALPSLHDCSRAAGEIVRYVRWLIISNIVGITIVFADRALVASSFTPREIAAYLVPMEVILRGQIVFTAVGAAVFPRLSSASSDLRRTLMSRVLMVQAAFGGVLLALAAIAFPVVPAAIRLWLGPDYGTAAAFVASVALLGLIANGIANIAVITLNATGRTAPQALVHVAELLLYLPALACVARYGQIEAIAAAWFVRNSVDMCAMQYFVSRASPGGLRTWLIFASCSLAASVYFLVFVYRLADGAPVAWFSIGGVVLGSTIAAAAWAQGMGGTGMSRLKGRTSH